MDEDDVVHSSHGMTSLVVASASNGVGVVIHQGRFGAGTGASVRRRHFSAPPYVRNSGFSYVRYPLTKLYTQSYSSEAMQSKHALASSSTPPSSVASGNGTGREHRQVVIVGAGFSGLGMAIALKRNGIDDFVVLERGADVGGTWWHNTYPGCRCDTPSRLYSFAFAPNSGWSETYARQAEIQAYLRAVAEREGIVTNIRFGVELAGARWNEDDGQWELETSRGPLAAEVLVLGTGALSEPRIPDFSGLERFEGTAFHSAHWNHDHALAGERVAVIGTGASAVQIVPSIAGEVGELQVYQRSPAWVLPHTGRRVTALERRLFTLLPAALRVPRDWTYFTRELLTLAWTRWQRATAVIELVCRVHLRRQVRDTDVRRRLTPSYRVGCKRLCPSNAYYPAFNRPNVELITEQIREIRARSILTADGAERGVDTIVFATGFYVTDSPAAEIVHGRDGRTLAEVWEGSPRAYMGAAVSGFPNMFLLLGPNTGNLTTSVVHMIEAQIKYALDCVEAIASEPATIEVRPETQAAFVAEIDRRSEGSVWLTGGCQSWYLDRTGRQSALWPGFSWDFHARARRFRPADHIIEPIRTGVTVSGAC